MKNLVEELRWRGLFHDMMPGTEEQLLKEATTAYIGFDPTADSLHIGSLVQIILLMHLRKSGHKAIALVGGATGMIGDPSGKSNERNLLDEATLNHNVEGIKRVLSRFLDFDAKDENAPILVNNYDWMKDFSFIDFARDIGKRITVNYMMSKDSVKKRLSGEEGAEGMSFTEFTYQLIQGYDFYHLNKHHNCLLQMGGSDQWGNITTGTELVRRMNVGNEEKSKAFALTTPLITKADGSKFGKSEGGNVWLDADKTSVYKFYQFWLNSTDVDAEKYIKIFTFLDKETIEKLIAEHNEAPHLRALQKRLAEEITVMVHSAADLENAIAASNAFFSPSMDELKKLDEKTFLEVFEGVPQVEISKDEVAEGVDIVTVLNEKTGFIKSKTEARRALAENSVSVNKGKVSENFRLTFNDLINNKFVLLQRGKKNYFIVSLKNDVANTLINKKITKPKKSNIIVKSNIFKSSKERDLKINRRKNVIVSGFTPAAETKYYQKYNNLNVVALPLPIGGNIQNERIFNLETIVEGVLTASIQCNVVYTNNINRISVSKSVRVKTGLRKKDNVNYKIDDKNGKILVELK